MNRSRHLRRTAIAVAMGLAFASGAAYAQQTVGTVLGTADPGATVEITNIQNGANRSVTVGSNGSFTFTTLRPGTYNVVATENGKTVKRTVTVTAGGAAAINLSSNVQKLGAVKVSASSLPAINTNSVQKTTVFTAKQMAMLPVPRNEAAVALLAPSVTSGDPTIPGGDLTIAGNSTAENSYYVNGFPVVSQFRSLRHTRVPFEAIAQETVKTGGYGAKFGYATGGVISVVTKRGTNTWKGGFRVDWEPASLRGHNPDVYLNNNKLRAINSDNDQSQKTYAAWVGGPLIKNKLFFYGLIQQKRQTSDTYLRWGGFATAAGSPGQSGNARHEDEHTPFYLVKLDWDISDNNILEYTGFGDEDHLARTYWFGVYGKNGHGHRGSYQGTFHNNQATHTNILKYTGYITPNVTVTAQYGHLKHTINQWGHDVTIGRFTYDGNIHSSGTGCPVIIDLRKKVTAGLRPPAPSCDWAPGLIKQGAFDSRTDKRIDIDWVVGNHDIRAGYDDDQWQSDRGSQGFSGGALWYILKPVEKHTADPKKHIVAGTYGSTEVLHFNTSANVSVKQRSFYVSDHWHITNNFMLYLGVRNDSFANYNGHGATYVSQDNIWQPRVGFSWDVSGDSTFKIYGTAGVYSLPVSADVALRGAAASIYNAVSYRYTSINQTTGKPEGLTQTASQAINGETGNTPPAGAVANQNLKPIKQREFTLGMQKQLWNPNWTFGVKLQENTLINTIDDTCLWAPFQKWGLSHGHPNTGGRPPATMPGCWIINPGSGATFNIDVDGDGTLEHVVLTKQDLGEPKARRKTYMAILTLTKAWSNNWYMRASYTWLHNFGNTEGLIKSDFTNAQLNTGTTEDFDFPLIMEGAGGNLPNDRASTFKLYGAWRTNNHNWTFSGNLFVQTGRPKTCQGVNPALFQPKYKSVWAYGGTSGFQACHGHLVPRGSLGFLPTMWHMDLGVAYTPQAVPGLKLAMYVVNVFDRHTPVKLMEQGEKATHVGPGAGNTAKLGGGYAKYDPNNAWVVTQFYDSRYGIPAYWQQPRTVRFTVQYNF